MVCSNPVVAYAQPVKCKNLSGVRRMIIKLKIAMRDLLMAFGLIESPGLQPVPVRTEQSVQRRR